MGVACAAQVRDLLMLDFDEPGLCVVCSRRYCRSLEYFHQVSFRGRSPMTSSSSQPASIPGRGSSRRLSRRANHVTGWMLRQELKDHLTVPLLGLVLLALFGGSRFDETRSLEAVVVALAAPVVAMTVAVAPLHEADSAMGNTGRTTAVLTAVGAELALVPTVFGLEPVLPLWILGIALGLLAITSVAVEAKAARRGFNTRFGAWTGMVAALALYLPGHYVQRDVFGWVVAASMFAAIVGGGLGLGFGLAARRWVGARV